MLLENSAKGVRADHQSGPWLFMAVLTAIALFLAGCTSEAKVDTESTVEGSAGASENTPLNDEIEPSANPSTAEPSEQTPSTPAEPKVSKPKKTTEMASNDIKGAGLSAIYFLELYNYTIETGDSQDFAKMSTDNCAFCEATNRRVQEDEGSAIRQIGGLLEFDKPEVPLDIDVSSTVPLLFYATESTLHAYDANGIVLEEASSSKLLIQVDMVRIGERWLVEAVKSDEDA